MKKQLFKNLVFNRNIIARLSAGEGILSLQNTANGRLAPSFEIPTIDIPTINDSCFSWCNDKCNDF